MTRLPRIKGKELVRALERAGFSIDRTRGSHAFLKHPDGRSTAIPTHARETLGPGPGPGHLAGCGDDRGAIEGIPLK